MDSRMNCLCRAIQSNITAEKRAHATLTKFIMFWNFDLKVQMENSNSLEKQNVRSKIWTFRPKPPKRGQKLSFFKNETFLN